jgi:Mor family transcriptional regulator
MGWIDTIAKKCTIEDLPESYREIAEIVGVEGAIKLSRRLGGLAYYFPQIDAVLRKKRDDAIRKEFTGRNYRDLAIKYGLTEVWIRDIVDRKPPADQPGLF